MARAATGNVYESRGKWYARVSLGAKVRPTIALPACSNETEASARLLILAELATSLRGVAQPETAKRLLEAMGAASTAKQIADVRRAVERIVSGKVQLAPQKDPTITVCALAERWMSGELHREFPDRIQIRKTANTDRSRFENHIFPIVRDVPIDEFTIEHAEQIMRAIPAHLEASTRAHVARLLNRLFALAVYPLRLIKANPMPRGFIPGDGKRKALPWIYPDEDARLLACAEVPLCERVLYGFIAREGMRASEACNMTFGDVDLIRGAVRLDENKTDDPRAWALSPGVPEALRAWRSIREERGENVTSTSRIFINAEGGPVGRRSELAGDLRKNMKRAGIDRAELYTASASRIAMRLHDLRGTFVTVSLANGKTDRWVKDRTGHKSSRMVDRYTRIARTAEELGLGPLRSLVDAIPELAAQASKGGASGGSGDCDSRKPTIQVVSSLSRMAISAELGEVTGVDRSQNTGDSSTSAGQLTSIAGSAATSEASAANSKGAASPRATMLDALAIAMRAAVEVGDVEAARVAHEAIGRLLGAPMPSSPIVDLARERDRRR